MAMILYKEKPQQHIFVIGKVINFKIASSSKINDPGNSRKKVLLIKRNFPNFFLL